jgi:hypothetical protein
MSRGADRITIGDRALYAVFVPLDGGLRLRLSADEWESLGLLIGTRVDVAIPGEPRAAYFVRHATYVDPGWQWVEFARAPSPVRQGLRRANPPGLRG